MANSSNNKNEWEEWVEPTNIPNAFKDFGFNKDALFEMIDALADATTLSEAESGVNWVFERDIFLDKL